MALTTTGHNSTGSSDEYTDRLTADIALLKELRQRTLGLVVDSRAYSNTLSAKFGCVRDEIDGYLSRALLRRELDGQS